MIAGLVFLAVGIVIAAAYALNEWNSSRKRARDDAATAVKIQAEHDRREVEIDHDKTPKFRTEKEIRDDLKARHPPTHRIIR